MAGKRQAAVAASDTWTDPDGIRAPAGEVHAWLPETNQTLCGLALSRTRLFRFPHVPWEEVNPESGGWADRVQRVCPRCEDATGKRPRERRWTRVSPRP
jgi:hypothetical protein